MKAQVLTKDLSPDEEYLSKIHKFDDERTKYFDKILKIDNSLSRQLVSFQGDKAKSYYCWYKYKEAFSSNLVQYLLSEYNVPSGTIFDPFAGIGTALFASSQAGYNSEGIELLPIGVQIIKSKLQAINITKSNLSRLKFWKKKLPWKDYPHTTNINYLRITKGAYPENTEQEIGKYLSAIQKENAIVRDVLFLALLSILESISYTRKDGQYLRWDYRSKRANLKSSFNKGKIHGFEEAIVYKLNEILNDLEGGNKQISFIDNENIKTGDIKLYEGSCLKILPEIEDNKYQAIITSPPYCNRYDYTRTYALELALQNIREKDLLALRQEMLSCTVENKEKELFNINKNWEKAITLYKNNSLLQSILSYLEYKKSVKQLNNTGIPRMVKGYFSEMACVIQECFRVLKKGGLFFMVNDNVRYAGVSISVDLILSELAKNIGFQVENILVLPTTKGNSSQQMGIHGRKKLRKCIYVWRKAGE